MELGSLCISKIFSKSVPECYLVLKIEVWRAGERWQLRITTAFGELQRSAHNLSSVGSSGLCGYLHVHSAYKFRRVHV